LLDVDNALGFIECDYWFNTIIDIHNKNIFFLDRFFNSSFFVDYGLFKDISIQSAHEDKIFFLEFQFSHVIYSMFDQLL
jgi:hypothetical protein